MSVVCNPIWLPMVRLKREREKGTAANFIYDVCVSKGDKLDNARKIFTSHQ